MHDAYPTDWWGYAILVAAFLALTAYALWPRKQRTIVQRPFDWARDCDDYCTCHHGCSGLRVNPGADCPTHPPLSIRELEGSHR